MAFWRRLPVNVRLSFCATCSVTLMARSFAKIVTVGFLRRSRQIGLGKRSAPGAAPRETVAAPILLAAPANRRCSRRYVIARKELAKSAGVRRRRCRHGPRHPLPRARKAAQPWFVPAQLFAVSATALPGQVAEKTACPCPLQPQLHFLRRAPSLSRLSAAMPIERRRMSRLAGGIWRLTVEVSRRPPRQGFYLGEPPRAVGWSARSGPRHPPNWGPPGGGEQHRPR